jgi:hypothetical protein
MKHGIAIGALVLLAVAAAGMFYLRQRGETPVDDPRANASTPTDRGDSKVARPVASGASNVERTPSTPAAAEPSLQERFASASDYHGFARSLLDSAKAGDSEAQYVLFQVLDFCEMGYRVYFDRRNRRRTLDEAMQWASTRTPSADPEEARDIYDKCNVLMTKGTREQFGARDDWLAAATENGHPVAEARSASKLLAASSMVELERGLDSAGKAKLARERHENGMNMMEHALRSADPEVLWTLGDYSFPLAGQTVSNDGWGWVWRIAACQRGYDCGAGASWHRFYCRFDFRALCMPGETGMDLIRREAGVHFPEYEELARELNRLIDAGAWDQIKLVPDEPVVPGASQ